MKRGAERPTRGNLLAKREERYPRQGHGVLQTLLRGADERDREAFEELKHARGRTIVQCKLC